MEIPPKTEKHFSIVHASCLSSVSKSASPSWSCFRLSGPAFSVHQFSVFKQPSSSPTISTSLVPCHIQPFLLSFQARGYLVTCMFTGQVCLPSPCFHIPLSDYPFILFSTPSRRLHIHILGILVLLCRSDPFRYLSSPRQSECTRYILPLFRLVSSSDIIVS